MEFPLKEDHGVGSIEGTHDIISSYAHIISITSPKGFCPAFFLRQERPLPRGCISGAPAQGHAQGGRWQMVVLCKAGVGVQGSMLCIIWELYEIGLHLKFRLLTSSNINSRPLMFDIPNMLEYSIVGIFDNGGWQGGGGGFGGGAAGGGFFY